MDYSWVANKLWLIPLFPLIGVVVNGMRHLTSRKTPRVGVGFFACLMVFLSFLVSVAGFLYLLDLPPAQRSITNVVSPWIDIGGPGIAHLEANIAFLLDPLSAVMILVVTGVGFLIHLYSVGYMAGDEGYARYFTWLNLFVFAMLVLVLGNNILLLFVGWEGVGLCSYLLISFWYKEKGNTTAGNKAFIVNRIGDLGFLIGIFILFWSLGEKGSYSLDFLEMREHVHLLAPGIATAAALCLFIGATGKSAQIPLYVWLPDAMAGPTPVSALIHAATMVTAGVYMIGRMNFLYTLAPDALTVVMWVGALTAIFAATIGLAQNDIKKVLAYSTVSQLGYMFLAMGVGAYAVGIFHLMTHAFFKACLFLGSGSVIHAMSGEQDMRRMGGLKAYLPITYWTFLIASVAIAGIFPFAGFFSKDEILWRSYSGHHYGPWILGLVAAVCTAFYMFRLISLTFYGSCRADEKVKHHIHESPWTMTVPLIVLAFLSVVGGFVGIPHALTVAAEKIGIHGADGATNLFGQWLAPVFAAAHHAAPHGAEAAHASLATEYLLMVVSVALALVSIAAALFVYLRRPDLPATIARRFRLAYDLVYHKYYVDEIYEATVIRFTMNLMRFLGRFDLVVIDGIVNGCAALVRVVSRIGGWLDLRFVDGLVNLVADLAMAVGRRLRLIQTGSVQIYLYTVLGGMVAILIIGIASGSI